MQWALYENGKQLWKSRHFWCANERYKYEMHDRAMAIITVDLTETVHLNGIDFKSNAKAMRNEFIHYVYGAIHGHGQPIQEANCT